MLVREHGWHVSSHTRQQCGQLASHEGWGTAEDEPLEVLEEDGTAGPHLILGPEVAEERLEVDVWEVRGHLSGPCRLHCHLDGIDHDILLTVSQVTRTR